MSHPAILKEAINRLLTLFPLMLDDEVCLSTSNITLIAALTHLDSQTRSIYGCEFHFLFFTFFEPALEKRGSGDDRIYIVRVVDGGSGRARKYVFKKENGELVAFKRGVDKVVEDRKGDRHLGEDSRGVGRAGEISNTIDDVRAAYTSQVG